MGLAAFFRAMRTKQFDDPEGDANRILTKEWDDHPKP
jgi:cbb3-type cytochrome oxidase maturation protein